MTRREAVLAFASALTSAAAEKAGSTRVRIARVPESGLQPQVAVDGAGALHLLFYTGDYRNGDLAYAVSHDGGRAFTRSIRVNSEPGSALAAGTIRGGQIALGKAGRVHVAWNGSKQNGPMNPDAKKPGSPMLYSRIAASGAAFDPQRNLMTHTFGLDGGGAIAADRTGNVYVAWHGIDANEAAGPKTGEARRRVWIAKSADDGRSFAPEAKAWSQDTGACGCCGMKIFADEQGEVSALYRSATESVHRDIYLLRSDNEAKSFDGRLLHKWDINACPMSSMDIAGRDGRTIGAWETGGQIYWSRIDDAGAEPTAAPGEGKGRKHPRVALNSRGEMALIWTEGTGWQKGGSLAYQLYDRSGRPVDAPVQIPGVPAWSFGAAAALHDDRFLLIY